MGRSLFHKICDDLSSEVTWWTGQTGPLLSVFWAALVKLLGQHGIHSAKFLKVPWHTACQICYQQHSLAPAFCLEPCFLLLPKTVTEPRPCQEHSLLHSTWLEVLIKPQWVWAILWAWNKHWIHNNCALPKVFIKISHPLIDLAYKRPILFVKHIACFNVKEALLPIV